MACQRMVPWSDTEPEPPFGAMACFLPGGGDSAPDCHDQDEMMIVLAGGGVVDIADEGVPLSMGEVVVIPRNLRHVVRNSGTETLAWVSVYWPLREPVRTDPA
jgi:mannose-6-phosphate isomerase-like protein (cupin superfamily)